MSNLDYRSDPAGTEILISLFYNCFVLAKFQYNYSANIKLLVGKYVDNNIAQTFTGS